VKPQRLDRRATAALLDEEASCRFESISKYRAAKPVFGRNDSLEEQRLKDKQFVRVAARPRGQCAAQKGRIAGLAAPDL
jgi:hypothetical protein